MDRMKKSYFINEDGMEDRLIIFIDCFEKIQYHALCDYHINLYHAFCDDLNMYVVKNEHEFYYINHHLKLNQSLYTVNQYSPHHTEAFDIINPLIDQGIIVAVRTMFDMLSPYCWYGQPDKIGSSNTHFCLLIGYTDEYYHFVDDPGMMDRNRFIKHPDNPTVGIMKKEELLIAFEAFCEITTVEINKNEIDHVNKVDIVMEKTIKNYYGIEHYPPKDRLENHDSYIGREALKQLIERLHVEQNLSNIIQQAFSFHLIRGRRIIFQHILSDTMNPSSKIRAIVKQLQTCINNWEILSLLISKYESKPYANFNKILADQLDKIILLEDNLIEQLSDAISNKQNLGSVNF